MALALVVLDAQVAGRCREIETAHGDWPCRAGCDDCCRSLARRPELTAEEWERLRAATEELPLEQRQEVVARAAEILAQPVGPYVCPWLDRKQGRCRVYAARPIACRTYGFYVERNQGLYCGMIRRRVEAGEMDGVVWGNHASIEAAMGPSIPFAEGSESLFSGQ